jgi:hypothetical protein
MRQNDTQTNVICTDDVYVECLLRSNLDENEALEILRHKRPNLVCFIFKKSKIYTYYMSIPTKTSVRLPLSFESPLILTRIIFSSIKTKNDLKYCNFFFFDIYF